MRNILEETRSNGLSILYRSCALIFLTILLSSCTEKETANLFDEVVEHYGGSAFFKSTISYTAGNFNYKLDRDSYRLEVNIEREDENGVTYTTNYKHGNIREYIDGEEQKGRENVHSLILSVIEGFTYANSIPHVLMANDIEIKQLDDITLNSKTYKVLYAKTKFVEDIAISQFYLYIDENTKDIAFMSQDYAVENARPLFKRFYNHRTVNGLRFADYTPFATKENTIPLSEMINFFNAEYFKPLKEVVFTNITVSYKE